MGAIHPACQKLCPSEELKTEHIESDPLHSEGVVGDGIFYGGDGWGVSTEYEALMLSNFDNDPGTGEKLCKFNCGRCVQPGLTKRGNPYDTCCRTCAVNPGMGLHASTCGGGSGASTVPTRPACPKGSRCRQRDDAHLKEYAHPLDSDYTECCTKSKIEPEALSLKVLFDWTDADGSGKLSREELEGTMHIIEKLMGEYMPPMTEEAWSHLDEDGNGVVNFSEFATWAGPRLGLPLGMKHMMHRAASTKALVSPCSVLGCPCEMFEGKENGKPGDKCKCCKHKRELHKVRKQTGEVPFPDYWDNVEDGDWNEMIDLGKLAVQEFQGLLDRTYKNTWTRDRTRHNPTKPEVPKRFCVMKIFRNENCHNWVEYGCRRAEVLTRLEEMAAEGTSPPIQIFDNVKSMVAWREIGGTKADRLAHECNEWYLFHGTTPAAAKSICANDFKVSRAGSNTGTLYGKGLYFAESITKADEYAKPDEKGNYAVLLCRVIGGNVLYTADPTPDPESLVHSCIEGPYDSVLGDREVCRGTFKEYVLFDSEDVYPEYIILYKRAY